MANPKAGEGEVQAALLRQRADSLQVELDASKLQRSELDAALDDHRRAGAEREMQFRLIVESVRDYAIFMLDVDGRIATWNIGAERIKGYRASEIIGKHFSQFYRPEEVASGKCELELAVAAREGRFEDEGWRVRKDGTEFWANVIISAVRDADGTLLGYSKVTRDLTDRKRAEEERAMRAAAEEANRAKDEFLAMLGHELRNPLAPIVTALQLMKLRGDGRTSREVQVIERQVNHMMRLVDDLLDIARITRGKIVLKRQRIDLRDIVAHAIEVASPLIEQRAHHLQVHAPDDDCCVVDADSARMTQVLANLLVNAAKYTDPGGHIAVTVRRRSGQAFVEVKDDGRGIEPALLGRIFDLFVQGYQGAERSGGGLGIGLTLVRTLVQMHNGVVTAHSAGPGQGSTFTVALPCAAVAPAAPDSRAARSSPTRPALGQHAQPAGLARARRPMRVLIVDDNDDARTLLAEAVAAAGHRVESAPDAVAALELAGALRPDVAVLDIGLPVMDGYQLAAELRTALAPQPLRLIALSGYGQPHDRERSEGAGFHAHLVKPVDARTLVDAIDDAGTDDVAPPEAH